MEILRLCLFFRRYSIQHDANKIDVTIIAYIIISFRIKYSYDSCLYNFYFYMKQYQPKYTTKNHFEKKKTIMYKMRMSQKIHRKPIMF